MQNEKIDITENELYKKIQKRKKVVLIRALLLIGFIFAINAYAWFIYVDKFSTDMSFNLAAWDVALLDNNVEIDELVIEVNNAKPGMADYEKEVVIRNNGDLPATLSYEIESVELFGVEYDYTGQSISAVSSMYENDFPFHLSFATSVDSLPAHGGSSLVTISFTWPYENPDDYYRLNEYFEFDPKINYYDDSYVKVNVTSANFSTLVQSGLFVESDDADTFFGKKSADFKTSNPTEPSIRIKLKLVAIQDNT